MDFFNRNLLPVLAATLWISISEFVRNELLLKSIWVSHYQSLGLDFPSALINGAVWGLWSLLFAVAIFYFPASSACWKPSWQPGSSRSSAPNPPEERTMMTREFRKRWEGIRASLAAVVDSFLEEELDFQPFPGSCTVCEIILHIAQEEYGEVQYGIIREIDA